MLEILNNVETIVSNSQYTKDLAIKLGVNEDRIIIINPGVDKVQELNKKTLDEQVSFSIERVGGIKLLRKFRNTSNVF